MEVGSAYVNLYLSVLNQARKDNSKMWLAFKETKLYKVGVEGNVVSLDVAWWVFNFSIGKG